MVLVSSISNIFITKMTRANKWMSFSSSNLALASIKLFNDGFTWICEQRSLLSYCTLLSDLQLPPLNHPRCLRLWIFVARGPLPQNLAKSIAHPKCQCTMHFFLMLHWIPLCLTFDFLLLWCLREEKRACKVSWSKVTKE